MHAPFHENLTQNIFKNVHLKYQYFGPFRQCVEKIGKFAYPAERAIILFQQELSME